MLYLIESAGYYKVGFTENMEQRLAAYNTTNPDWKLIHQREGNLVCERALHRRFHRHYYRNEWFYKDEEIETVFRGFKIPLVENSHMIWYEHIGNNQQKIQETETALKNLLKQSWELLHNTKSVIEAEAILRQIVSTQDAIKKLHREALDIIKSKDAYEQRQTDEIENF